MCECEAVLKEDAEQEIKEIFPKDNVPLKNPILLGFRNPATNHEGYGYEIDLKRVTGEQREKIVDFISRKFNYDKKFVEEQLDNQGLPLREENVACVSWCQRHIMALIDFTDDYEDYDDEYYEDDNAYWDDDKFIDEYLTDSEEIKAKRKEE